MQKEEGKEKKVSYKCNRLALTFFTLSLYWCALCYPYLTDNPSLIPSFSHTLWQMYISIHTYIHPSLYMNMSHVYMREPFSFFLLIWMFMTKVVYLGTFCFFYFLCTLFMFLSWCFSFFPSRYRGIDTLWNNGWSLICSNQCIFTWTLPEMHESYVWDMNDGLIWIHGRAMLLDLLME